ncbi:MAG: pyridoxamine 5'-phosphate oxidase [Verrucomicrobia bacterium]|nr:MAG: pyridoxamine 5'-phosphate oxidase [Verrucomicrobiota bacterium]
MLMPIADLRRSYTLAGLRRADLDPDPIAQFGKWLQQTIDAQMLEPTAMTLATVGKSGRPSARIVLLKGVDERGLIFYTNYESRKARELAENPQGALVFYWAELERQVRVTGVVSSISREESEAYFKTRPRGHQLGAWVSTQSDVIASRGVLEERLELFEQKYPDTVPLPPFWGGYILSPTEIEFWQGRQNRLHDRFRYTKQANGNWLIERLAP